MFAQVIDHEDRSAEFFMRACQPCPALVDMLSYPHAFGHHESGTIAQIAGWSKVAAWAAAQEAKAIARLNELMRETVASSPTPGAAALVTAEQLTAAELGAALRLSPNAASERVARANALATSCRPTRDLLETGAISGYHARVIVDEVANLPLAAASEVQARVLPRAEKQTVAQMRRSLARAILAVDPAHSARKTAAALAGRGVSIWAQAPGVACLGATMQADHALEIYNELDRRARLAPSDDPRPIDARRSDALLALCLPDLYADLDPSGEQPDGTRAAPGTSRRVIRVTMSRDALVGLTNSPAVLEGHGPIPAELGRHLAADAEWERWILQPETGELLDAGALTYVPSKRFAEFLAKRDSTCRFPGCGRPATRCDVEHAEPFNHSDPTAGGKTTRKNCRPVCRMHHRVKTHSATTLEGDDDGSATWTLPSGRRYRLPPQDHGPEPDKPDPP